MAAFDLDDLIPQAPTGSTAQQLENAVIYYRNYLLGKISDKINECYGKIRYEVVIKSWEMQEVVGSWRFHEIHYGLQEKNWFSRIPLPSVPAPGSYGPVVGEGCESPFRSLQRELFHRGWFLYEISNPVYGTLDIHLIIHNKAFTVEDGYFGCEGLLWHHHNTVLDFMEAC